MTAASDNVVSASRLTGLCLVVEPALSRLVLVVGRFVTRLTKEKGESCAIGGLFPLGNDGQ